MIALSVQSWRTSMQEEGKENQKLQSANKTNTYFLLSQLMPDQIIHRKLSPSFKWMQHWSPTLVSCSAHTNPHIHWLPCLPQGHGRFHLIGKRRLTLFSWTWVRWSDKSKIAQQHKGLLLNFQQAPWFIPRGMKSLFKKPLTSYIAKHTVYRVHWDRSLKAYTEKQESQTVHKGSPSPGMAQSSPELQPTTLRLSTRSPVLTATIPNFPKTYDYIWNHCCLGLSSPREPNTENPPKKSTNRSNKLSKNELF